MPTADDKKPAWLRFEGEAKRIFVRRIRLSRDGLFLFSRRYAAKTVTLSAAELSALFEGKTCAVDVQGEYVLYLRVDAGALDAVRLLGAMSGLPRRQHGGGLETSSIPQREDPGAQPTFEQRVLAARIRVRVDKQQRRPRKKTPEWIVELAKSGTGR